MDSTSLPVKAVAAVAAGAAVAADVAAVVADVAAVAADVATDTEVWGRASTVVDGSPVGLKGAAVLGVLPACEVTGISRRADRADDCDDEALTDVDARAGVAKERVAWSSVDVVRDRPSASRRELAVCDGAVSEAMLTASVAKEDLDCVCGGAAVAVPVLKSRDANPGV